MFWASVLEVKFVIFGNKTSLGKSSEQDFKEEVKYDSQGAFFENGN